MRAHYWQFLINTEGQPIQDANISVYIANTTIPASIYQSEYGGSIVPTIPQFSTTPEGYFEFWVDTSDYAGDTKFKIAWEKTGISTGFIDFVDVFYTMAVDETDVDILKNKTLSNFLAYKWEEHRLHNDIIDDVTSVHNIHSVDESDTDSDKNKLISNNLAKIWDDHLTDPAVSGAHGLEPVDENNINADYNKLLSNSIAKRWEDHVTVDSTVIDGSRAFINPVGGITPTSGTHLTTKDYVDTEITSAGLVYTLIDGSRPFTGTIEGVTPTSGAHLTTKDYVDSAISTSGSAYILIDGTIPFTGTVGGVTPAASGDLATKDYVDTTIAASGGGPEYTLVDGTRPFTSTVGGITPAASGDLATKDYVDSVAGSGGGGPEYTLIDGTRPFTGTVGGVTPAASGDLTTRDYVDSAITSAGLTYTLPDGSIPFTGTVGGITPAASGDLATKDYVDTTIAASGGGPEYTLVDGTRPFTGTVGGITPAASGDLATKDYVDSVAGSGSSDLKNDTWMKSDNYADTGLVNILKVNTDDEIVMGGTLHSGSIEASENSGAVVLFDMSVSSSAASGTEESVGIKIDGDIVLKCYSTSDGVGGIENKTVKVEDVLNIKPGSEPSTAIEGDIYMDSGTHKLRCHNGTIWNDLF